MNATPAAPTPALLANRTTLAQQVTLNITGETPTDVVKCKHLQPRMIVRAWFNGEPHGGERIVASVDKTSPDGATWTVSFSSAHNPQEFKAAYRWLIVGIEEPEPLSELEEIALSVIADTAEETVQTAGGREVPAHLTHSPFAEALA